MIKVKVLLGVAAAAALCLPAGANDTSAKRDGSSVKGTVKISGRIPRIKKIRMTADPKCAGLHKTSPPMENIVADKKTGLVKWAFVYVKSGAKPTKAPAKPVTITQKGCRYEPHVFGVQTGQPIKIKNGDNLLHNIHALPFNNKEFNFGQPTSGLEETKTFDKEEVMVMIKCDVHPWMRAWCGVLTHGFFSVTNAKGEFEIKGLPAGKYTVEVWHEEYKAVSSDVEVDGKAAKEVSFELKDRKGK